MQKRKICAIGNFLKLGEERNQLTTVTLFNTIFSLPKQNQQQIACYASAKDNLSYFIEQLIALAEEQTIEPAFKSHLAHYLSRELLRTSDHNTIEQLTQDIKDRTSIDHVITTTTTVAKFLSACLSEIKEKRSYEYTLQLLTSSYDAFFAEMMSNTHIGEFDPELDKFSLPLSPEDQAELTQFHQRLVLFKRLEDHITAEILDKQKKSGASAIPEALQQQIQASFDMPINTDTLTNLQSSSDQEKKTAEVTKAMKAYVKLLALLKTQHVVKENIALFVTQFIRQQGICLDIEDRLSFSAEQLITEIKEKSTTILGPQAKSDTPQGQLRAYLQAVSGKTNSAVTSDFWKELDKLQTALTRLNSKSLDQTSHTDAEGRRQSLGAAFPTQPLQDPQSDSSDSESGSSNSSTNTSTQALADPTSPAPSSLSMEATMDSNAELDLNDDKAASEVSDSRPTDAAVAAAPPLPPPP